MSVTPKKQGIRDKEILQSTVKNPSGTDFASHPVLGVLTDTSLMP